MEYMYHNESFQCMLYCKIIQNIVGHHFKFCKLKSFFFILVQLNFDKNMVRKPTL